MKKSTLISKPDIMDCWKCNGHGVLFGKTIGSIMCDLCNGTGKWIENHYIIIDNKNKIAIDSDTGS